MKDFGENPQLQRYRSDMLVAWERLHAGKADIVVPPRRDLHRVRPRSNFHPTPELFYQVGGATDFDCPSMSFRLKAGDFCVMPRGVPHAETPVDLRSPYGIFLVGNSRGRLYLTRARSDSSRSILGYDIHLDAQPINPELMAYLDGVSDHTYLRAKHRPLFRRSLVEAFLLRVVGMLESKPEAEVPAMPTLIQEASKYARVHLNDPELSVLSIARNLSCTPDHLSRQFHRVSGLTFTTWIAQERVASAKHLLEASSYNISEVGWACGFKEASYFIRIFKKFTGLTPRQYRLQFARG